MSDDVSLSAVKRGAVIQVPREILLDVGMVEQTPAERREADRREAEADMEQRKAARLEARRRLAEITEQPARAVLDLHKEDRFGCCDGCEFGGYEAEAPDWPCETTELIAKHYGIETEAL